MRRLFYESSFEPDVFDGEAEVVEHEPFESNPYGDDDDDFDKDPDRYGFDGDPDPDYDANGRYLGGYRVFARGNYREDFGTDR